MRKDLLAAGLVKSVTYAGGIGEGDILRNVAPEGSRNEFVPETDATPILKKRFRPLGTQMLVRQTVEETSSTIILDQTEKEKPCEGTVLETGKDLTTVSVGDTVVFGKYSGQEFKLNGEILLILREEEVKGTLYNDQEEIDKVFKLAGCTNLGSTIGRA